MGEGGRFRYPSYVQDIMGPMFFDYGFGPFRWVCTSGKPEDLATTDRLATEVLEEIRKTAPKEIAGQLDDNIHWIKEAGKNKLVVGSQARILYADSEGRTKIALAFNDAIARGEISAPVVLGRDHHDVSGTDSPYRETSNIYDGSNRTADMAVQNVIGDSFRGATWVSIHNGGGVGWGEVINGGFGMVIDGSEDSARHIKEMLLWDVNNGIARPQLGPQRGRDVRYQTRDGAYPGPEGDPSQPGGRQAGSQGYRRSEIIDRSSLRSVAAGRRECFRLAEARGFPVRRTSRAPKNNSTYF